jgi:GINS complex subunit 1
MYGDLGLRLIRDSKRTVSLPALPPPQLALIRQILQEITILDLSATNILQSLPSLSSIQSNYPSEACAILIHHLCMRRNRRCLLAYQRLRADRIDEMVWAGGEVKGILSPEEEEYGRGYGLLVAGLKGRWTDVELGGSLEPPRDLYVEVRVLKDAGEIQTEYGYVRRLNELMSRVITLTKNSQLYVRQADVERLIQQGYLQRID